MKSITELEGEETRCPAGCIACLVCVGGGPNSEVQQKAINPNRESVELVRHIYWNNFASFYLLPIFRFFDRFDPGCPTSESRQLFSFSLCKPSWYLRPTRLHSAERESVERKLPPTEIITPWCSGRKMHGPKKSFDTLPGGSFDVAADGLLLTVSLRHVIFFFFFFF